jgi:hypothetical protein
MDAHRLGMTVQLGCDLIGRPACPAFHDHLGMKLPIGGRMKASREFAHRAFLCFILRRSDLHVFWHGSALSHSATLPPPILVPMRNAAWLATPGAVTHFTTQPGAMMALNVTIHATSGNYTAEMVTKANFEKLQAAFPNLQTQIAGKEWYHSPSALTHIETYTKEKDMQRDLESAYQNGWVIQGQSGTGSHVNVGRSVTKFVLTGGLGLMTGVSRSKDKTTITFVRSPEWIAQH